MCTPGADGIGACRLGREFGKFATAMRPPDLPYARAPAPPCSSSLSGSPLPESPRPFPVSPAHPSAGSWACVPVFLGTRSVCSCHLWPCGGSDRRVRRRCGWSPGRCYLSITSQFDSPNVVLHFDDVPYIHRDWFTPTL